jgi:hypothetical protein
MAKEQDRKPAFEKFMEGVNGLLADRHFREVLMELDAAQGEDALSLLGPDPAAFLRYRGVQLPQDFRFSVESHGEAATTGVGIHITCYCLRICWWRWCISICICRVGTAS